jgi:hypothetical protein
MTQLRSVTCRHCKVVNQVRDEDTAWTVTGRVWRGRRGGRGHYRVQAECICLQCSSTWWSTHPHALEELERQYEGVA